MLHGTVGANWQMFNLAQKQRRKDMLHVYGDKKRLVPPKSFYLAEPKRKAVLAIFLIQVNALPSTLYPGLAHLSLVCIGISGYAHNVRNVLSAATTSELG